MTYFSVLSRDLKLELLQHFWITEINILSSELDEFKLFVNDELFWREIYRTHIASNFSYKNLCLTRSDAILNSYLYKDSYTKIDCCLVVGAQNALPYCFDQTNNIAEGSSAYITCGYYEFMRRLVEEKDINTITYLYKNKYIISNHMIGGLIRSSSLFKYFVPSIIGADKTFVGKCLNEVDMYLCHSIDKQFRKELKEIRRYLKTLKKFYKESCKE